MDINERYILERIKNDFGNNIPCNEVFFNNVNPEMIIDHDLVDQYLKKDTFTKLPKKKVRVDMLIPTQMNLDGDKLSNFDVSTDTGAVIYETEDGNLYIVDGHHRIAKNILNNNEYISAFIKETSSKQNLNESNSELLDKKIDILKRGYAICCEDLGINKPKLNLINNLNYTSQYKSFAAYSPSTQEVYCVIAGRNTADCMRSIAHELMHHKQNLEGRLYNGAGEDGTDIENEANSYSGKIMRRLGRELENIFEDKEKLTEGLLILSKKNFLKS